MRIPICKPSIDDSESESILEVLRSGWLMQGAKVEEFEDLIREYTGANFAVATSSCSTALHLAMLQCGIQEGDEVILPSLTWVATAAAVEACGGKPVFCDIDPQTFNIDANRVPELITTRTKALVAVNLFGLAADLPRLSQIACKHGVFLVEDAACSLGATVGERQSGTFGRLGCFSFHPRKSITTGEGGMVVGHCHEDEASLRSLRSHGFQVTGSGETHESPPYELGSFDKLGYNYRLTDLQAAVGIAQFKKLEMILKRRREIAAQYNEGLSGNDLLQLPSEPASCRHTYQSYVVMVRQQANGDQGYRRACELRNNIMLSLQRQGIATRPGTHAVHNLAYYRLKYHLSEMMCPHSLRAMNLSIALPLYPTVTEAEIAYVIEKCHAAVRECRASETSSSFS